ncbi:hypothetical protein RJD24_14655 [Bacillaceae bacterium IKA-2]|nr:hypothetical protein RJD24_14655 [Bacillaceae bacterium IKA-2]
MSYQFDIAYKEYYPSEFYNNGKRIVNLRSSSTTFSTSQVIGDNTVFFKKEFENEQLLDKLRNSPYYMMLRTILSVDDTMTKYILLYSLLYLLNKDSQNQVNRFIKEFEPNVEDMTRIRSSGEPEEAPVYTTLRNRIGHISTDENIVTVIKEMERTMPGLLRLVKISIRQTYSSK